MIEAVITSSVLIAALILLRVLFAAKISRRLQYALWGLVLLRLCLPFGLPNSPVSVMNTLTQAAEVKNMAPAAAATSGLAASTDADAQDLSVPENVSTAEANNQHVAGAGMPTVMQESLQAEGDGFLGGVASLNPAALTRPISAVWITGSTVMALWFAGTNVRFRRRLFITRAPFDASGCPLPVYVTPVVASPCLAGVFRPAVYLTPKAAESGTAISHILSHELAHYSQGDHIWTLLRGLCLVVYWWNPLVWAAAMLSLADGEMACDETVVRQLGEENRLLYGRTLVDMITVKNPSASLLRAAATMMSGKQQLKKRLGLIVKKPKTSVPAMLAAVLAVAVLAGCTFTGAQAAPEKTPEGTSTGVTELAQTLYDLKNPYIGDASGDGALLEALDISSKLGSHTLELETSGAPYILRLVFADPVTDGGAFDSAMINNAILLLALIDNASEIQWEYLHVDEGAGGQGSFTGSLTAADAAATMNVKDIKAFAQSAASVQELLDRLPKNESVMPRVTVATVERGEIMASYSPLDDAGTKLINDIIMDCMRKSAAWPAVDTASLDTCYLLRSITPDGTIADYYAFRLDGKAVLQTGGYYSRLSDNLYEKLVLLAQSKPAIDRTDLDACVSAAILDANSNPYHPEGLPFESHVTFKIVENGSTVTVYVMALHMLFDITAEGITELGGSHMPVAVTFEKSTDGTYVLKEYWVPQDGTYYSSSIHEKFPADVAAEAIDSQAYILQQMQACYSQAVRYGDVDTGAVIGRLFDKIMSAPAVSSNSQDYMDAHPMEYRQLLYYGDHTLRYIYSEFLKGGQTGLKGHLMLAAMIELLGDEATQFKAKVESPQAWFEAWKADAKKKLADSSMEYMRGNYPKAWLLLQML
jgi:beta-lactamase regulating signal transducer with metallopeptidase domain